MELILLIYTANEYNDIESSMSISASTIIIIIRYLSLIPIYSLEQLSAVQTPINIAEFLTRASETVITQHYLYFPPWQLRLQPVQVLTLHCYPQRDP